MKYLLDTNTLIRLFQGKEPLNARVRSLDPNDLAISGFTEAEIISGVENSSIEFKEQNRLARTLGMQPFQKIYHDAEISADYGKIKAYLMQKKIYAPSNELDLFIAATATAKKLILVTENIRDFKSIPKLKLENWSI